MSQNELLEKALALKADEKFLLIDALLKSLDTPTKEIDSLWKDESQNRLDSYKRGHLESLTHESFFQE